MTNLAEELTRETFQAAELAKDRTLERMRSEAPVDSGDLRDAIEGEVYQGADGNVVAHFSVDTRKTGGIRDYAAFVDRGTSPYTGDQVINLDNMIRGRAGVNDLREIKTRRGQAAQPFFSKNVSITFGSIFRGLKRRL